MNTQIEKYISDNTKVLVSAAIFDAQQIKITNAEGCNFANQYILQIKRMRHEIETKRTEVTKPINDGLKKINQLFKQVLQPLDEADGIFALKIMTYKRQEAERIAKKQKELESQVKKEEKKLSKELGQKITMPIPQVQSTLEITTRTDTKWRLISLIRVPDEYKMLDETKITKAVRSGIKIPGIEIYQEEILVRR